METLLLTLEGSVRVSIKRRRHGRTLLAHFGKDSTRRNVLGLIKYKYFKFVLSPLFPVATFRLLTLPECVVIYFRGHLILRKYILCN